MSEIIYFYVKGQGWLGGYEEHLPKPKRDDGWFSLRLDDVFIREMREYQARISDDYWTQIHGRQIPRNIPRQPRTQSNPARAHGTTTPAYGFNDRYFMVHDEVIPQRVPTRPTEPRTTEPHTIENQTYFAGSGVTAPAPEESQHERRVREFRDAERRWRRR